MEIILTEELILPNCISNAVSQDTLETVLEDKHTATELNCQKLHT